ncbi:unnamed protein product [Boreogadus saida]
MGPPDIDRGAMATGETRHDVRCNVPQPPRSNAIEGRPERATVGYLRGEEPSLYLSASQELQPSGAPPLAPPAPSQGPEDWREISSFTELDYAVLQDLLCIITGV